MTNFRSAWWLLAAGVLVALALLALPVSRHALMARLPPTWRIALEALRNGVVVEHDLVVTMPDGVRLAASLYRPRGDLQRWPTVLVRLPYHRLEYGEGINSGLFFARHGYAVLVQDLRGTGDSGGELLPWKDAESDGAATLDWIAQQPWSSGKVGTFGCSALGETQWVLAKARHPAHAAMIPSGAGGAVGSAAGRYSYFGVFEGGVFQLASAFGWFATSGAKDPLAAPPRDFDTRSELKRWPVSGLVRGVRSAATGYDDFLATPLGDATWDSWGYLNDSDRFTTPTLTINTWGDQTAGDALAHAEFLRRADPTWAARQKVVIAPGKHCYHEESATTPRFGDLPLADSGQPYEAMYLAWFDHWLRGQGEGLAKQAPYLYFTLVENRWREATQWPPAQVQMQRWSLDSGGKANTRDGDGRLAPPGSAAAAAPFDRLRYDPNDPVPSRGGPVCCTGDARDRAGPVDQADVETRADVLVYTSAPLARALRIVGPLKAHLVVSTDVPDTDLVARLTHVWPDGRSTNIQEGALRLRYRDGITTPRQLEPGRRYAVEVDMRSIAYQVPQGHRLRLQVTSSSFPRLERNLNTGGRNADEAAPRVATTELHHAADAESYLELPVLED